MGALRALALSALLLVATAAVAPAEPSQYLCVAEQAGKLHYNAQAKTWAAQPFVTDDRFILRQLNNDDRKTWAKHSDAGRWGFFKVGEALPTALCGIDLNNCSWGAVEFDSKDGALTWRWYRDNPSELDGVVMETGKCSAL
jgi:hypothetical protein